MAKVIMIKGDRSVVVATLPTVREAKQRASYYQSMCSCRVKFRVEGR